MDSDALLAELGLDPHDVNVRLAMDLAQENHDLIIDLIRLRREQGLTQIDIAERLGVTQSSISGFERAGNDPRLSTLRRYAQAIGVRVTHSCEIVIPEPIKENDNAEGQ